MGPAKAVLGGFRAGRPEWVTVTVMPLSLGEDELEVEAPVRHDKAILDYSPATRSYRYTIDGGLPDADNRDRFAVEPAGSGARSSGSQLHGPGPGASFPTPQATQAMAERTTV